LLQIKIQKVKKKPSQHTASDASLAALNRLDRCWFILALGATPSIQFKTQNSKLSFTITNNNKQKTIKNKNKHSNQDKDKKHKPIAINSSFLGRTMLNNLSM
jgi:hypothetical protein